MLRTKSSVKERLTAKKAKDLEKLSTGVPRGETTHMALQPYTNSNEGTCSRAKRSPMKPWGDERTIPTPARIELGHKK